MKAKTLWRWLLIITFFTPIVLGLVVLACYSWVERAAQGHCYDEVSDLPAVPAALVLGCSPTVRGRANLFYTYRMDAAIALWESGKVKAFIVSGDNGTHQYDEPTAMKARLIAAGVPEQVIYCDYAGFRTLDSVVRTQAIFGQRRFIVISQPFHTKRAVFLAQQHGLEAIGLNAKQVPRPMGLMTYSREYLARVKAVLDVTLLQTKPKFSGPKVEIKE